MKKIKFLIVLFSMLIMFESAITGYAAYETEKNSDFATADEVAINELHTAFVDDSFDYFLFTVNSDGYINIEINHEYGSVNQSYTILDENKKQILNGSVESNAEKTPTKKFGIKPGKYYLKIFSNHYNGCPKYEYTFKISFTAADNWEKEYNNNVVNYTPISLGKTYYGTTVCSSSSDRDYYKFSVPKDSYVSFVFNKKYDRISYTLTFKTYDLTKEKYVESFDAKYNSEQLKDKLFLKKGDYYFVVEAYDSSNIYNFTLSLSQEQQTTTTTKRTTTTTNRTPTTTKTTTTTQYYNPTKLQQEYTTLNPSLQQGTDDFNVNAETEQIVPNTSFNPTDSQELQVNGYTDDLANESVNESPNAEIIAQREEANDNTHQEKTRSDKIIIIVISVASVTLISALAAYIVILKKSKN